MVAEAWDMLRKALVLFRGKPVGTIAAMDSTESALNYDQVREVGRGGLGVIHPESPKKTWSQAET